MKKLHLSLLLFILSFASIPGLFAQGSDCASANAFCTGSTYTFPATTGVPDAQTGPDYGCLYSEPNPAWYYLQVGSSGDIVININSADASGSQNDVDFICYGPFTSLSSACSGLTGDCDGPGDNPLSNNYGCNGNIVDCSYSASASEVCGIPGAVAGQWYMLMLTNYADVPSDITFSQSNTGAGAGSTNCDILCSMTGLTALAGSCNPATNTFPLLGTISYTDEPTTGSLVVTDNCTGTTQTFNAPFASGSTNFTISGLPANGAACSVTAVFTADSTCTFTTNYTAPPPCSVTCSISNITFIPTACNSTTQQYDVNSGSVTFINAPTTGTLTITNSCGGTPVVLNAPFTSPAAFSFSGLSANGASCSITAVFSANTACTFTQTYTAPAPCPVTCAITALTATPTACNSTTQQYSVNGSATFVNAPTTGTLTITNSCGGSPVVLTAPFTSPATYSFTGLSSNGNSCTVSAVFSADATCTATQTYTAPAPCLVTCSISGLTATPSACDPSTNNYSVSGSITFVNPPATGTLTVTNSCGGSTQTFSAPFTSPLAYALNGLTSDGNTCTVTAAFSDDAGCTATQSYSAPASCSLCPVTAGNSGPYCQGDSIRLTATTVPGASYSWTGPMGFTSTLQNPLIPNSTIAMEGNYVVSVFVPATPSSAACNSASTTAVVVNANPTVSVNAPVTCSGVPTTLTATGAATYLWTTGQNTATITVPGTNAPYEVIGFSAAGCVDTAYTIVTTTPLPVVSFTSDVQNGCNPVFVHFTADGTGNGPGAYYDWDFGDGSTGTGLSTAHLYESDGCHTVTLTASYSPQCSTTDSIVCMVDVYPQPDASFYITPPNIDILNPNAQFINTSSHSTVWMWNFGDGGGSFDQNPAHTYPAIGTYPVTLYASGVGNCIDSATNYVVINDISTMYVPNAFTPNGDGNNDVFNVGAHGVSAEDFELLIFDRWGNRILKTNDLYEGWNGAMNNHGEVIEQDVYVYKISYKDLDGRKHKLLGHVTLVN